MGIIETLLYIEISGEPHYNTNSKPYYGNTNFKPPCSSGSPFPRPQIFHNNKPNCNDSYKSISTTHNHPQPSNTGHKRKILTAKKKFNTLTEEYILPYLGIAL